MKKALTLIISSLVLSGCSSLNMVEVPDYQAQQREVNQNQQVNNELSKNIQFVDAAYLSEERITPQDDRFKGMYVEFESQNPIDIQTVLNGLASQYKIQYVMADELVENGTSKNVNVKFAGSLLDFFDYLSSAFNMHFEFAQNDLVKAYYYKNHVFNLQQYFDGNAYSTSFTVGGTAGAGAGLSGSTDLEFETNSWERIEEFLDNSLDEDEKFTVFEDYSLISVRARPEKFYLMDAFFERMVEESKMQIAIDYRVISFSRSKLNQLAVAMGVNNAAGSGVSLSPTHAISGIIDQLTIRDENISTNLNAVVNDLAQSVEHEAHFVTLPNRVIPLNITTNEKYISSIEYTFGSSESERDSSTVEVADLVTGFSMMLLPKILDDGRIMVTSSFSRKQLLEMGSAEGVSLPVVDENESSATVTMDSGEVRLVTLFRDTSVQDNEGLQLLGGATSHEGRDRYFAVLIGVNSYKSNSFVK